MRFANGDLGHSRNLPLVLVVATQRDLGAPLQRTEIKRKMLEFWEKTAKIGDAVHSFGPAAYVISI
jgi:hypothetical protein